MAHWLLAATTATLLWLASAAGLEPVSRSSGLGVPGGSAQSVDLLAALALHNTTRQGVLPARGPHELTPAYYLQGDYRDLKLPPSTFQRVVSLLRSNPEFTFVAWLRQDETNSGSIVSFSHGYNRYLELQSSGRKDEIRLHYTSQHDATVHVETFPYRLADNAWHQLAVSVSGAQVELLVDCHPVYRRVLRLGAPDRNLTESVPQLQLWVGQRNNRHSLFKGAFQDVRVITGSHGYLAQCPHLNSSCPTCGQFSLLQSTVQELTRHLHELSERLVAAEGRIGKVEECDCQKSCQVNGTTHMDGTTWKRDCDMCSCVHGEVECRPVQCPNITCKFPVYNPGQCCPSCLKQCLLKGVLYDHGQQVTVKECIECDCIDGNFKCIRISPETMCPLLQCSPDEQFSVPGECCKFCPGVDYCARGHICHTNATCLNLQTTYTCHCDQGFQGDGHSCTDVDECQQQGGMNGHHCQSNTKCVNTPGSYVCECLSGYRRIDKFNCAELDECSTGEHGCDLHADCVNTQGSYHCVCQQGYIGDGYNCKPICNGTCFNGGECVSPNKCSCRKGYTGTSCERDVDECAESLHRCHPASLCVNMPGWYYCKCKPGYRSILKDNTLGMLCEDIDECKEKTDTCHHTARCINTEGGFRCACTEDRGPECRLSCIFEGNEIAHSMTVSPSGQPCRICTCDKGVITCSDPVCDCTVLGSEKDKCCPQCDPKAKCTHQELHEVEMPHGERWTYQCQTCECLWGQVDCWDMDCPPLTCSDPVLAPGDCCPRCDNDPCAFAADDNATNMGQPCTYAGRLYDSGTKWSDPDDPCTSCNCKVPFCAQLVSNVACCVHRTDIFAAVLISVAATLAARWGTMEWWLEQACPRAPQRQNSVLQSLPFLLLRRPTLSQKCLGLDTIAQPYLVSIIIVIKQCRTLVTIQNSIVQLYEWIMVVVFSTIVQCRRQRRLRFYHPPPLVTQRPRIRLRRLLGRATEDAVRPAMKTLVKLALGAERHQSNSLEHSTLETQVYHCESCETFPINTCELHSN